MHAATAGSLARARRNAANALKTRPETEVRIIVNAEAVTAAIEQPDPDIDRYLVFCETTLARIGRSPLVGSMTVPTAVLAIAECQQQGWIYLRA